MNPGDWRRILAPAVAVAALGAASFLALYGRDLRNLGAATLDRPSITHTGAFTNVLFLHHSVGQNLIDQGRVRELFTDRGYLFWDQGYNANGLTRPDGTAAGYHYRIPNDNTNPDGFARIFAQPVLGIPINALSGLLQHEVIVLKSCFPVSNITSDEQFEAYRSHYLSIRDVMDQHQDRLLVLVTPPPLNPAHTDPEAAGRARAFAEWLTSEEYLGGHLNIMTFDFFDLLAADDPTVPDYNMLRAAYREGADSHPNTAANEAIGPLFVDSIVTAVEAYRSIYPGDS